MLRKSLLVLLGILFLGLALRVFKLAEVPLYGDELTMVADSYSLLHTGLDQTGQPWPLTFSMGAGRPAGYVYASIPFVAIFGPTVWGVRGLSVLSSLGIILVMFFLARKLFNDRVGLLAAFLVAVSPWDLNLGRGGFESHFALFLALWGTYLLLNIKTKKINLFWAVLVWGLTINTYPTFKLILPVFLPVIIWYLGGLKTILSGKKNIPILAGILAMGIIGVTLAQSFIGGSEDRFKNINVFSANAVAVEQDVIFNRNINSSNSFLIKFFYNKPLSYLKLLKDSYLKNFSLEYLIISGDGNPRHNMASTGVIYVVEIITLALGLLYLVNKKENRRELILILAWLFIAPLAAIFTMENHGLRTNFMLPPLIIFSAIGILYFKKPIVLFGIGFLWFVQFIPMLERTYFLAPDRYARFWSNLAKRVAIEVGVKKNSFDYVIVSTNIDNIEYAYPIYNQIDPKEIIANNQNKINLGGYEFKKYDNVYIGSIPQSKVLDFLTNLSGKVMYVGSFPDAHLFGSYQVLYDGDKLPSGIIYE